MKKLLLSSILLVTGRLLLQTGRHKYSIIKLEQADKFSFLTSCLLPFRSSDRRKPPLRLLSAFCLLLLSGCLDKVANSAPRQAASCPGQNPNFSIEFFKTNNRGERYNKGINHVIIFNPQSPALDFKVNVGLAHKIYAKDSRGRFRREYVAKRFSEIISDENSQLDGKSPIAAINADYIDPKDKPQGLNISRGVEYSGDFKNRRSSFGISGGNPRQRRATIGTGRRRESILNYNLVGGNGRFYQQGKFKDICKALGEFACKGARNRSMAAVTSQGYVIFLVNDVKANSDIQVSENNQELFPNQFDDVLTGIAKNNCLGSIQEGILFDGGMSPGLFYNNKTYVENLGPIGSVFLIYKK